jgi:antitoxin (DNA-binding transcriptional repressor) of toxin-antitoxin stability system
MEPVMSPVSIEEAQLRLPELIDQLQPGEVLIITRDEKPVARLTSEAPPRKARKAGSAKGLLVIRKEDDQHLADFAAYME